MDIFVTQLSRQLQTWLDRNPWESTASLARATGLSNTTLRRSKSGKAEPDPETVRALLPILEAASAFAYLERTRTKDLREWSDAFVSRLQSMSVFLEEYSRSIHGLVLIELCSGDTGTSCDRLERIMGISMGEPLSVLTEHGFIRRDKGKLNLIDEVYRIVPESAKFRKLRTVYDFLSQCPEKDFQVNISFAREFSEYGIRRVLGRYREFIDEIDQLSSDPENVGDILYMGGAFGAAVGPMDIRAHPRPKE